MLERWYKALWSRLGGRPWTYIARDLNREWPLLFPLVFLSIGIAIGRIAKKHWWKILLAILAGIVIGHIFWEG